MKGMIYGRRPRQLLIVWGFSLLLILLINWLETQAPAVHELVLPFYWIILAVAFYLTWRWLRARSHKDRRGLDRRHADRRDENESPGSEN
jgi:membrane protein implicated in regulation of membrane protease activity